MAAVSQRRASLTPMELMIFFESLELLLASGINVVDSLKLMLGDTEKEKEKDVINEVLKMLASSYELSSAMERTGFFPSYAISMIRLAEHSGNLDNACASLAAHYEIENCQNAQIKSAVLTPFILVCVMAVVVAFLVNAILPIFSDIYRQMGVNMTSNLLVQSALTIGTVAMWAVFAVLFLTIAGFGFSKTKLGKRFFAVLVDRSPVTRTFLETLSMARFTSTFSMLLTSGDDLPVALSLSSMVCPSRKVRRKLDYCYKQFLAGGSLFDVLKNSGLFNPAHLGMIKSGVRSGSTPKVMQKLSDIYEQESERRLSGFLSFIEPAFISVLSVVIGIILICIMLPLIGILSSIA